MSELNKALIRRFLEDRRPDAWGRRVQIGAIQSHSERRIRAGQNCWSQESDGNAEVLKLACFHRLLRIVAGVVMHCDWDSCARSS